jgi:hypothetical protein
LVFKEDLRTSKTKFLKAYFKQKLELKVLIINSIQGLKSYNPQIHNTILIDDTDLSKLSRKTLIALFDNE